MAYSVSSLCFGTFAVPGHCSPFFNAVPLCSAEFERQDWRLCIFPNRVLDSLAQVWEKGLDNYQPRSAPLPATKRYTSLSTFPKSCILKDPGTLQLCSDVDSNSVWLLWPLSSRFSCSTPLLPHLPTPARAGATTPALGVRL